MPAPNQFGGSHPDILARFIDHLSSDEKLQLRLASYPRILDEKLMISLLDQFLGGPGMLDWKSFCSWSFITGSGSRVVMHSLMRDALQANALERRPALFHDVHRYLAQLFVEMAKVDQGAALDAESDA